VTREALREVRRRKLLKGALIATAAAAVSPLHVIQETFALGAVESGVYRLKGTVLPFGPEYR
jgi:hypothetical protein